MTALHLRIADFKFTHNFIIYDRLPDTEIIFAIDIQKKLSLSYAWDKETISTYKNTTDFSYTPETVNRRQQQELLNQLSRYLLNIMAS